LHSQNQRHPYQFFAVGHYNCPAVVVRNVEDEVSKLCPMKMRVDGQSLIRDMVGFKSKFEAELTKMRKHVEILLQFSKRIIAVVGLKEQKTRDSVLLMMVMGASGVVTQLLK